VGEGLASSYSGGEGDWTHGESGGPADIKVHIEGMSRYRDVLGVSSRIRKAAPQRPKRRGETLTASRQASWGDQSTEHLALQGHADHPGKGADVIGGTLGPRLNTILL